MNRTEIGQMLFIDNPLLDWYDTNARVLPWRSEPTPYRVWVSEIMLQQTRVETVVPYYLRFMEALPDVFALARVEEDALLKLWEGLGYYSRAKNLKKAAQMVETDFNGIFPSQPEDLKKLPGIGEYTAGAIASIAYQMPVPAVDGNVLRVLSRLLAYQGDIGESAVRRKLTQVAQKNISPERPGDFNQAMMDLGATICLPNGVPLCAQCPLTGFCLAYQEGSQENFPVKIPKKPRKIQDRTIFVIENLENQILLMKRPERGLLAGMWEFLNLEGPLTAAEAESRMRQLGFTVEVLQELPEAKHVFTHIEWRMKGYFARVSEALPVTDGLWVERKSLSRYALPSAMKPYLPWGKGQRKE